MFLADSSLGAAASLGPPNFVIVTIVPVCTERVNAQGGTTARSRSHSDIVAVRKTLSLSPHTSQPISKTCHHPLAHTGSLNTCPLLPINSVQPPHGPGPEQ